MPAAEDNDGSRDFCLRTLEGPARALRPASLHGSCVFRG